jgi:hypothetical protein
LVTPAVVVGEAARLIRFILGASAEAAYVRLMTGGSIKIIDLTVEDWVRVRELVERYVNVGSAWWTPRSSLLLNGRRSLISPA